MWIVAILVVFTLVAANALFVAAEFAAVASRKTRLRQMAEQGNRLAALVLPLIDDSESLDRYVAGSQIGITISSLLLGAFGQRVLAEQFSPVLEWFAGLVAPLVNWLGGSDGIVQAIGGPAAAATIVLLFLTVLQVIGGELVPKSVAMQRPEGLALTTAIPMKWALVILRPFVSFLNGSGRLLLRLMGVKQDPGSSHVHSPEEIELLVVESHEGGLLDHKERQMLRNALRLRELTARQVMAHRTRLVTAPVEGRIAEHLETLMEAGYSRLPIYQGSDDNIIGFVHIKDLLRLHTNGSENLAEILREVTFLPESLPIMDVWKTLRSKRQYMAIIFDEYGGTAGLITMEDLIEEIFGELQDEFDEEGALISLDESGRVYLRADLLISDVNEYLALELPDEHADTLSGMVLSALGRPPQVGDRVQIGATEIRVESVVDLGVGEVSLSPRPGDDLSQLSEWEVGDHE